MEFFLFLFVMLFLFWFMLYTLKRPLYSKEELEENRRAWLEFENQWNEIEPALRQQIQKLDAEIFERKMDRVFEAMDKRYQDKYGDKS